jgi:hypothetical protein
VLKLALNRFPLDQIGGANEGPCLIGNGLCGLENRCPQGLVGSSPMPSAIAMANLHEWCASLCESTVALGLLFLANPSSLLRRVDPYGERALDIWASPRRLGWLRRFHTYALCSTWMLGRGQLADEEKVFRAHSGQE